MKSLPYHGLLVVDKPGGWTSRDVVDRAQRWFPRGTRLGHTGTLDPLATGVLVLCVGVATRLTEYVQDMDKFYRAGLLLGARSDTDDADGILTQVAGARAPEEAALGNALRSFVGEIAQVPPAYSAAKVTGRRAYDLARQGEAVLLKARPVRIYGINLVAYAYPRLGLEVHCGKGTYIRSLARDLGERLGCGALVESLRRTRVGPFDAGDGLAVDSDPEAARRALRPLAAAVVGLPRIELSPAEVRLLRWGQAVALRDSPLRFPLPAVAADVAVFSGPNQLAAVCRWDPESGTLRPEKVLPEPEGAA
jgi:tRNA pseudouridine55 synthase